MRLLGLLLCIAPFTQALSQVADTTRTTHHRPFFTWRDAALFEAFAIATVAIAPLDTRIANHLQNPGVQENNGMRKTAEFVRTVADPGSFLIGIGMYGYGRITKNRRAADLGLHGTEALLVGAQMGNLMKGIVGRARPYVDVDRPHDYKAFRGFGGGNDYRSFPSGHTIAAFAAASAVTSETRMWWPKSFWVIAPVMYGGAAVVGWSRMYNNKHWASDVLTGAAIGTFAGQKVVLLHHNHPNNFIDRIFGVARVSALPHGQTFVGVSVGATD